MSIVLIVIYCFVAATLIFGITFHDEVLNEKERRRKVEHSLTVIRGGKKSLVRLRRHV
jgi:hypothetical protein